MKNPIRIQRKRTKGWRMPENTVYVGRPSKWGNKYKAEDYGKINAIRMYEQDLHQALLKKPRETKSKLAKLEGKNLACWCPVIVSCHADILLKIANAR